jgi:hypothetical protein
MIEKLPAKFLASGDAVYFPRAGTKTIRYTIGLNGVFITFLFTDGTRRALELEKILDVRRPNRPVAAGEGEVTRRDLETGRESVTSPFYLPEFSDIRDAFRDTSPGLIGEFPFQIARRRLEKGAIVETEKAVYIPGAGREFTEKRAA